MKIIYQFKKIIIFLFIFVIFFELASLIASKLNLLFFNSDPPYLKKKYDGNKWRLSNEHFGNWHKINSSSRHKTRCFDINYESNNFGARDNDDYNQNYYENSTILIGDSFAEGFGVKFEKTFFYYLKNYKNNSINLGVSGTNPFSHLERFNYLIKNKKNINELIYFFLPQNDWVNYTKHQNKKNEINIDSNILKNNKFKTNIIQILDKFSYSINTIKTLKFLYFNRNTLYKKLSYDFEDKKSIDFTYKKITQILKLNIPKKTLIIIPTREDFKFLNNSNFYKKKYWYKKLIYLSEEYNFKIINLHEHLNTNIQYKYFLECDGHWSDFGNLSAFNVYKNQNN